jgi:hypothetical protein
MGRPSKNTVDYFPHDVKYGETIPILEAHWGNDGYAFWFKLLEMLGGTEGHYIDLRKPITREVLASKTHLDADKCHQILDLLAELGAIDEELWTQHNVVWCQKLVDYFEPIYTKRKTEIPRKPEFSGRKLEQTDVSAPKSTQRRVEKSRVEKNRVDNTHAQARAGESARKAKRTKFVTELFDKHFWPMYPRKKAKQDALKAFKTIFPITVSKEQCNKRWRNIVLHVEALKAEERPPDMVPYPATFLRAEDFDEPPAKQTSDDDGPKFEEVNE